ncbi:MAG: hypothetical protein JXB07_04950 [Anaerolineae bacterium]|nr:hypothetical protein [Anaerolineae bacterium]
MALIRLWELAGLALIVEKSTGVHYSNQTGGTTCMQPEIEGVLIPIRNDVELESRRLISPENDLYQYFAGPPHQGTGACRGLSLEDADFIDGVLKHYKMREYLCVDRERLAESHEAWVFVLVNQEPASDSTTPLYTGLGPYPARGVLTWANTD